MLAPCLLLLLCWSVQQMHVWSHTLGMISTEVVRMDSSCMVVGRYTKCLAGFSMGPLLPPGVRNSSSTSYVGESLAMQEATYTACFLYMSVLIPCSCCRTQDPGLGLLCWAYSLAAAPPQLPACTHAHALLAGC